MNRSEFDHGNRSDLVIPSRVSEYKHSSKLNLSKHCGSYVLIIIAMSFFFHVVPNFENFSLSQEEF